MMGSNDCTTRVGCSGHGTCRRYRRTIKRMEMGTRHQTRIESSGNLVQEVSELTSYGELGKG